MAKQNKKVRKTKTDKKPARYEKNKFTIKMQKKLVVLVTVVLLAFVGLSARLYMLVRANGDTYKRQVLSQQEYDSTTVPYKRGDIVDANGTTLATSQKVYNVVVDSKQILNKEGALDATVAAVARCFQVDESALREYIMSHENSQYYVVARRLTYDEIEPFQNIQDNRADNTEYDSNVTGVWFEEEYQRTYPYGTLASDVLGFTGSDNNGMNGLEQYYNEELNGTNGREYGYLNDDSTLERTTVPAEDGYTLVSTLDANIQNIVETELKAFNAEHEDEYRDGLGAYNTGCIIMDPNSGEVLAMASYPQYDCNDPYDLSELYTEEEITAMTDEEFKAAVNNLWQNFCITSTYEPGSTQKPFTVAAGLESGTLSGEESYYCEGYLQIGGYTIHCHNRFGHGTVSVKNAMESSCNVALMHMGAVIGKTNFLKYQSIFNFGLRTNIDLAGEARTDALVYTDATMNETELATSSFGQGYNVTMIQMITAYCSLINGGDYYEPHMVSRILNADGATVKNIEPRVLKQTVSAATSEKILEYCNAVVEDGTGKTARPAGYSMGGKTGTAETALRDNKNYLVSFIGYVPANDPQVAIYVVVDRANQEKQDNSRLATGIVRNILTQVLPYMGIPMTEELSEEELEELSNREQTYLDSIPVEDTQTPEGEDGEPADGADTDTDGDGTDTGADSDDTGGADADTQPQQPEVVIDPETGYAIDPVNGEWLDPVTGEPIDPDSPMMEKTE